jgi:hypothetical protein
MRSSIALTAAACVTGLSLSALAAPASADPGSADDSFPLTCDNGQTYDITTSRGQGEWTPGFDTAGTTVLLPMSFGNFVAAGYLASEYPGGEPLFTFEEPAISVKPAHAKGLRRMDCSFEQVSVEYDSELDADIAFVVTGDVTVAVRR